LAGGENGLSSLPVKIPNIALIALAASSLLTGCVTGRRSFDVGLEAGSMPPPQPSTKGSVMFGTVTDSRQFENKPDDPSTPSVNGDVNSVSADDRSHFIGRQRNGFGHAMGDITLPDGKTVQGKMVEIMSQDLMNQGYSVVASGPTAGTLNVDVLEFWSWMRPGFFALSFEAKIGCKVTITGNGKTATFRVRGSAVNHGQFAKDKNWQEAYEEAFADFLKDFDLQLKDNGF
jgi:uncharacterized lipoprotein YajG